MASFYVVRWQLDKKKLQTFVAALLAAHTVQNYSQKAKGVMSSCEVCVFVATASDVTLQTTSFVTITHHSVSPLITSTGDVCCACACAGLRPN